jgi:hypothetical protein
MHPRDADQRPRQVAHAVLFLWLSFVVGITGDVITFTGPDAGELFTDVQGARLGALLQEVVFVVGTVYVSRGRNWARILVLVLFILSTLGLLFTGMGWGPLLLQSPALYLLFTEPGSLWFRRRPNVVATEEASTSLEGVRSENGQ